ncbi:MAG TPA: MBL fold metallo-hydrolase [Terracidiphilus sp.]|nr:MBL fold metallo-hydrolase [Terracidiphilus sp.]HUX27935.1 MBL fold metallo-hydrolase [Terracidiphilus sp.]
MRSRDGTVFAAMRLRRSAVAAIVLVAVLGVGELRGQTAPPRLIAPGVWFLLGDAHKGYSNTAVIEMQDYLIVVDANYPGRARELIAEVKQLSPKPVRYVFDTHAHGDHTYGNSVWTAAGATTIGYYKILAEMDRYEPARWQAAEAKRADVRDQHQDNVQRPLKTFRKSPYVLKDATREVEFLFLGWGHTPADGYVWLPKERVLCTGDGAVNGPRNKLWDANIANWPRALEKAIALRPLHVLPGHGDAGGIEILEGQREFLLDLYSAVKAQVNAGKTLKEIHVELPERDGNWVPKDLAWDIEATYTEITHHEPAGAAPHEWK